MMRMTRLAIYPQATVLQCRFDFTLTDNRPQTIGIARGQGSKIRSQRSEVTNRNTPAPNSSSPPTPCSSLSSQPVPDKILTRVSNNFGVKGSGFDQNWEGLW